MPKEINGFVKLASPEYYKFLGKYKFQIAFENCLCKDYMTEKLFRPLCIGSVPVYFGSENAQDFMPSNHSVIMAQDFESPEDLARFLLEVNANDTLYDEYLRHRQTKQIENQKLKDILQKQPWRLPHINYKPNFGTFMFSGFTCHVCDSLHERNNRLVKHLSDKTQPIMEPKMADQSHMGCPAPVRSLSVPGESEREYYKKTAYDFGEQEAKAVWKMLIANETDTKTFRSKYLKMKTDKYS